MAEQQLTREVVDKHFKRLRGKLFTLTEASLPGSQQEAFKRQIKVFTQAAWHGIILDAGLSMKGPGDIVEASLSGNGETVAVQVEIKEG